MDSIRNYLGEKEFRMSEILQFSIMLLLAGFLIGGGIIILNDEDIFKKIYEGYQGQLDSVGPDPLQGIGVLTDSADTRPIIPDEEKMIISSFRRDNRACIQGTEQYIITGFQGGPQYYCIKCPDGRILEYSDGTPVSPGELSIIKLVENDAQSGMRCKLSRIGTTTVSSSVSRLVAKTPAVGTVVAGTAATGTATGTTAAAGTPAVNQRSSAVSNTWTADLPDDLLLVNLQKNVKFLRKKSLINTITAWTMIILGSLISIYQIYNLFFS